MASWFGTVVGVMGFRSVRTGVSILRPSRVQQMATLSSSSSSSSSSSFPSQQQSSLSSFPDYRTRTRTALATTNAALIGHRRFWNWRGGDDKKWSYTGGAGEEGEGTEGSTSTSSLEHRPQDPVPARRPKQHLGAGAGRLRPTAYPVSICTAQGYRSYMEDEYFVSLDGDFAAVFDGHGGHSVSRYLRKNLYANVQAGLPVFVAPATTTTSTATTTATATTIATATTTATTTTATASSGGSSDEHSTSTPTGMTTSTAADAADASSRTASLGSPTSPMVSDYESAIESALEKVDREVQRISHWSYQGSTAVAIWIHEDKQVLETECGAASAASSTIPSSIAKDTVVQEEMAMEPAVTAAVTATATQTQRTILAANVGDSRAVLCRNNTAWDLTRDHKPNDPLEKSRIEGLGGKVVWCGDVDDSGEPILDRGIYRVNGNLALSRAIGDRSERPHVTAAPEIITVPIQEGEDEFIILATDGLWDVLESDEAVELVQSFMHEDGHAHDKIATLLVEEALRRGTYDNVTVVIIWLNRTRKNAPQ